MENSLRRALLTGLCCSGLMLGGCSEEFFDTSSFGIFQSQEVNLTAKNYAAADYIIHQAKTFIGDRDLVKTVMLSDADEPRVHSKIGRIIPEQVGVRLSQLGYRMDLREVSNDDEHTNYLKPAMGANEQPDFVLSGTYRRRRTDLDVNLRIIDARSKRIVAVFDYTLPMNNEIAEMSEPETRIIQMSK